MAIACTNGTVTLVDIMNEINSKLGKADYLPTYSVTKSYSTGDIVNYNGHDYLAVVPPSAGAFVPAEWKDLSVNVINSLDDVIITAPLEGDFISYDATNQEWININRDFLIEHGGRAWKDATEYKVDDIVGEGGIVSICIQDHTSSAANDPSVVGQSVWMNDIAHKETGGKAWFDGTTYVIGDVVSDGGSVFTCTRNHIALTGDVLDGSPTQSLQQSWVTPVVVEHGGVAWQTGSTHVLGDLVSFSDHVYICIRPHTSSGVDDINGSPAMGNQTGWVLSDTKEHGGKAYDPLNVYDIGDTVTFNNKVYICLIDASVGHQPDIANSFWLDTDISVVYKGVFTPTAGTEYPPAVNHTYFRVSGLGAPYTMTTGVLAGQSVKDGDDLVYQGNVWAIRPGATIATEVGGRNYSSAERYNIGDVVTNGGSIFVNKVAVTVPEPFNPVNWEPQEIGIISDITQVTGSEEITNIIKVTQIQYDALTPPDATTLYIIVKP